MEEEKKQIEAPKELGIIERAEKVRDEMLASEKRTAERIADFERQIAEKILSGKADLVPSKSQEEKDKETADNIVKQYFN